MLYRTEPNVCVVYFIKENGLSDNGRVVTANLPAELVSRMEEAADRIDRSKSWIVKQAVSEWLAEEQRRYELTLEALDEVKEGRTISHEDVMANVQNRKRKRPSALAGTHDGTVQVAVDPKEKAGLT